MRFGVIPKNVLRGSPRAMIALPPRQTLSGLTFLTGLRLCSGKKNGSGTGTGGVGVGNMGVGIGGFGGFAIVASCRVAILGAVFTAVVGAALAAANGTSIAIGISAVLIAGTRLIAVGRANLGLSRSACAAKACAPTPASMAGLGNSSTGTKIVG
jgi:hypothetical protein